MKFSLPLGMGSLDFGKWFYGLMSAFISGASGAVYAGLAVTTVDHDHFNFYTEKFWLVILATFVLGGMLPFFAYLHEKPLPSYKQVTDIKQTTQVSPGIAPVKTVEIHTETYQAPIPPGEK